MKLIKLFSFTLLIVIAVSCAHTNELAKYDLNGKTIFYKPAIGPEAHRVTITTSNTADYSEAGSKKSTEKSILEAISTIGESILSADKESKLQQMVDPGSMVESITGGLKEALYTYLDLNEVETLSDKPDFICNVTLEKLELRVSKNSTAVYVSALGSIIDRGTGGLVWEYSESSTMPLSTNYDMSKTTKVEEDAINILQLATLDEDKVNAMMAAAVDDVGYYMAEQLREDIAESNMQ